MFHGYKRLVHTQTALLEVVGSKVVEPNYTYKVLATKLIKHIDCLKYWK